MLSIIRLLHSFFLVHLSFFFGSGVLVLLVFWDEVVHVRLSFSEFHFVHTLSSVPVEESLSSEHGCELFDDSLEHFLDGSRVSDEGWAHLESLWWNIADWRFNVVWNPLYEVGWVLVLDVEHLLVDFFSWHSSSEHGRCSQVSSVSWVWCAHHVLSIEHLLGELWDSQCSVLLRSSWGQWSESNHEEVKSWEWNQVNRQFSQIWVELTWESEACSYSWDACRYEVVQVSVCWGCELESSEANIVQGFVIDDHDFISIFYELMDWKSGVVWLNDGIWDFWWWKDWEGFHDYVWIFFSDLWDQEGSIPDPVPPPSEWVIWNPWRQSHPSTSFLTTSRTESMSLAPSV